jgi:hypothetical protein
MNLMQFRFECATIEGIIFKHEESFISTFCKHPCELIHVRLSSSTVEFVMLLNSGQHVIDGITWDQFTEWYRNV